MFMSIPEAAEVLGLHPGRVRRLVAAGELAGQKIGGRWLVDDQAVRRRCDTDRPAGRPLSFRAAWGMLWAADRRALPWLAAREQSRARARARDWPIEAWPWACRRRASTLRLLGHPSVIERVANDPRAVRSGTTARGLAIDLVAPSEAEVYLQAHDLASFTADYALAPSDRANVIVRTPPTDLWLFDTADAPWPVVVVDLLNAGDERSVRAAHELATRSAR